MTEIIMALGDMLFEEKGKQISSRTVDSIEPTAEISGIGKQNIKIKTSILIGQYQLSLAKME